MTLTQPPATDSDSSSTDSTSADSTSTAATKTPSTGTAPYPWPWDGDFRSSRFVLLVAGAQQGLARVSQAADETIAAIDATAEVVRHAGGIVCFVRHGALDARRPLLPLTGSRDAELCLEPHDDDLVVDSGGFDGFHDSQLDRVLRSAGRDLVGMCGLAHEVAVDGTCRGANDRGFECLTLTDLVAPIDPHTSRHALSSVTMSGGIFGAIAPSEVLLDLIAHVQPPPGAQP